MRSLRTATLGLAAAGLWGLAAAPGLAADNGTVDAQVTVATPCIFIVTPWIDYGTVPFSTASGDSIAYQQVTHENCSEARERIWAAGTDAASVSATWELDNFGGSGACAQPLNTYGLRLLNTELLVDLTETAVEIEPLGPTASNWASAALLMPCAGSDGAGQTMSFQIIFTATF